GISDSIKINEELPTGTLYETIGTIFSGDTVSGNFKVDINGSLEATTYDIINDDVTVDDGNNGDNYNVTYTNGELVVVDLGQHPDPIASELSLTYGEAKEFPLTLVDVEEDTVTVEPINEEVVTVSYDAAAKKITVTPVKAGNTEITVTVPETDACEEKVFTANVTVAKKALTYTVTAEEKIYNADYDFVANVVLDGVVNDDVVEVECIGASIPEKNVGEHVGKVQLRLTGTDSANYVFDVAEGDDSAEVIVDNIAVIVVPKEIIATVEAVNRTYDGTLDFETLVSLDGVLAVDEEFVTATATGELTSKNAGAYDADVTVSLSGDASVNYVLAEEVLNTSVEIYKKDITASVVAEDKIYDGKVDINATATLAGVLSGDTVTNSVVADVYSKNVGTYTNGHAIISLAGADADNYELAISEFNDVEVTISPKELTVTGLAATNRVTDETTVVALTGGVLDGIVEGDNVYATMPTEGTIADTLSGNNKVVTIAEITLLGADAANYTLVQPTGITVNIYAPAATPTYRPSYSIGGGSSSSTVTPDKTDENKEDNKEEAKDENKEEDKEEVKEETTTDYTKATATVTLKEKASEIRFISTDEEGKFNPDVKATRNEVVNALNEILNITDATGDCDLNDIENSENAKIVELFTKANIIAGYDDGTFRGNDSITRAEFVKILTVALGVEVKEFENDKVSDVADHWSKNFVNSFVELGYILGYPDGTFRPDESISRAEVVIIVNRVIGKDVKNADNTDVTISDMDDSHWAYEYIMASVK
ncbi:MAG: S-layer homology domain-containing protein, partial [Clostridia bacterium]|nr:S-layer homology domain-containing protein [Clostridia bacterium]